MGDLSWLSRTSLHFPLTVGDPGQVTLQGTIHWTEMQSGLVWYKHVYTHFSTVDYGVEQNMTLEKS